MSRPFDTHDKIIRPDFCECELPWSTADGPLKDGSHYSNCVAADVAEDLAILIRDRDRWRQRAETAEHDLAAFRNLVAEVRRSLGRSQTILDIAFGESE